MKDFFLQLKEKFMRPAEDDDLEKADQYVEVNHTQNKDEHSKVIVRLSY